MNLKIENKRKYHIKHTIILIFVLFTALYLFSCKVTLIGQYDQVTDITIQKVQTEIFTIIIKIDKNITAGTYSTTTYDSLKNDFTSIEGELRSLKIRCSALPKYSKVENQIQTLYNSVCDIEKLCKTKLTNIGIINVADSIICVQFKDIESLQNGLKSQK